MTEIKFYRCTAYNGVGWAFQWFPGMTEFPDWFEEEYRHHNFKEVTLNDQLCLIYRTKNRSELALAGDYVMKRADFDDFVQFHTRESFESSWVERKTSEVAVTLVQVREALDQLPCLLDEMQRNADSNIHLALQKHLDTITRYVNQ